MIKGFSQNVCELLSMIEVIAAVGRPRKFKSTEYFFFKLLIKLQNPIFVGVSWLYLIAYHTIVTKLFARKEMLAFKVCLQFRQQLVNDCFKLSDICLF